MVCVRVSATWSSHSTSCNPGTWVTPGERDYATSGPPSARVLVDGMVGSLVSFVADKALTQPHHHTMTCLVPRSLPHMCVERRVPWGTSCEWGRFLFFPLHVRAQGSHRPLREGREVFQVSGLYAVAMPACKRGDEVVAVF